LIEHSVNTESPSYVNVMFQVTNELDIPITSLVTADFEVHEDFQSVDHTESTMLIRKQNELPYTLYTVLMLENSLSVGASLEKIKNAAKELIRSADALEEAERDGNTDNQHFLIYSFSDSFTLLTPEFNNDVATLIKAIDSITIGFNSTNLFGSIIEGVSNWTDQYTTDGVSQGFLVLLTDGSDTQGASTLDQAMTARGQKKIITVGIGNKIDPSVLESLSNAGFYQIADYNELIVQFVEIQRNIDKFANSFYWLDYLSPKRGASMHELTLYIPGNTY
jgi:hypothetical protein